MVDVGAGILAVYAWLACYLDRSVVRALLGLGVVEHLMQQECGLQAAAL